MFARKSSDCYRPPKFLSWLLEFYIIPRDKILAYHIVRRGLTLLFVRWPTSQNLHLWVGGDFWTWWDNTFRWESWGIYNRVNETVSNPFHLLYYLCMRLKKKKKKKKKPHPNHWAVRSVVVSTVFGMVKFSIKVFARVRPAKNPSLVSFVAYNCPWSTMDSVWQFYEVSDDDNGASCLSIVIPKVQSDGIINNKKDLYQFR